VVLTRLERGRRKSTCGANFVLIPTFKMSLPTFS
jgi:hypothetical protein